jgi:hypothetical protein
MSISSPPLSPQPANQEGIRESFHDWLIKDDPQFGGRVLIQGSQFSLVLETMGARGWIPVDSVSATVLPTETFTRECGRSTTSFSGDTVGLILHSTGASTPPPRLVWFLDVGANQIRSLVPDSIQCQEEIYGD